MGEQTDLLHLPNPVSLSSSSGHEFEADIEIVHLCGELSQPQRSHFSSTITPYQADFHGASSQLLGVTPTHKLPTPG